MTNERREAGCDCADEDAGSSCWAATIPHQHSFGGYTPSSLLSEDMDGIGKESTSKVSISDRLPPYFVSIRSAHRGVCAIIKRLGQLATRASDGIHLYVVLATNLIYDQSQEILRGLGPIRR